MKCVKVEQDIKTYANKSNWKFTRKTGIINLSVRVMYSLDLFIIIVPLKLGNIYTEKINKKNCRVGRGSMLK